MNLKPEQIRTLMFQAADIQTGESIEFSDKSYDSHTLNEALREEMNSLMGNGGHRFTANRELVYALLSEVVDDLLPKRVFDSMNRFAEIKNVADGDKVTFKRRKGNIRGRNFVTQVAHAGLYEVFRLDREVFDMPTTAYGAAVGLDLEEFLEGRIDFAELIQCITEGYEEILYKEILRHMVALNSNTILPANNIYSVAGWSPRRFAALLGISSAYATPTIFTSYVFAAEMIPEGHLATEKMKEEYNRNGFIGNYKGANIVVLPHSFYNETNEAEAVTLPLGMAWILPDVDNKPVKIAFEGGMQTKEVDLDDWSKEMHFYKKMGTMLMANPAICIYENTALNEWPVVNGPIIKETAGNVTPTYTRLV